MNVFTLRSSRICIHVPIYLYIVPFCIKTNKCNRYTDDDDYDDGFVADYKYS